MSWSWYFGTVAIVPFVIALAAYWAAAGAVLGWLRGRGIANPFLTAAVWVLAEATVARVPLGGFSWGEVGYAFHNIGVGRALASDGGVALVTFFAVALNAFLADAVIARAGTAATVVPAELGAARRRPRDRGRPPDRRDRAAQRAAPDGTLRVAILQGNDKNRDLTAGRGGRALPARTATSRSRRRCSDPRRPDRVPRVEHGRRPAHRPVPAPPPRRDRPATRTRGCSPTRSPTRPHTGTSRRAPRR